MANPWPEAFRPKKPAGSNEVDLTKVFGDKANDPAQLAAIMSLSTFQENPNYGRMIDEDSNLEAGAEHAMGSPMHGTPGHASDVTKENDSPIHTSPIHSSPIEPAGKTPLHDSDLVMEPRPAAPAPSFKITDDMIPGTPEPAPAAPTPPGGFTTTPGAPPIQTAAAGQQADNGATAFRTQTAEPPEEDSGEIPAPTPGNLGAGPAHAWRGLQDIGGAVGQMIGGMTGSPVGAAIGMTVGSLAGHALSGGEVKTADVAKAGLGLLGGAVAGGAGSKLGSALGELFSSGDQQEAQGGAMAAGGGGGGMSEMVRLLHQISTDIGSLVSDGIVIRGSRRSGGTI